MNIEPELRWDKDQTMKNHATNSPDAHARYQVESYMAAAAVWRAEIQTKLYYEVRSVIIGTSKIGTTEKHMTIKKIQTQKAKFMVWQLKRLEYRPSTDHTVST